MIKPMLAQARSEPFNCDKHLFEVKWDGTRCLGFNNNKEALQTLLAYNEEDIVNLRVLRRKLGIK